MSWHRESRQATGSFGQHGNGNKEHHNFFLLEPMLGRSLVAIKIIILSGTDESTVFESGPVESVQRCHDTYIRAEGVHLGG